MRLRSWTWSKKHTSELYFLLLRISVSCHWKGRNSEGYGLHGFVQFGKVEIPHRLTVEVLYDYYLIFVVFSNNGEQSAPRPYRFTFPSSVFHYKFVLPLCYYVIEATYHIAKSQCTRANSQSCIVQTDLFPLFCVGSLTLAYCSRVYLTVVGFLLT